MHPLPARRLVAAFAALFLGLSALSAVVIAVPASAHASLVETLPADGDDVTAVPPWISLTFSDNVQKLGAEVQIRHGGRDISAGELTVDGKTVTVALPDQQDEGAYTVVWRVVSEDGHPISGTYGFDVTFDPGPGITDPAKIPSDPPEGDPSEEATSSSAPTPTAEATTAVPSAQPTQAPAPEPSVSATMDMGQPGTDPATGERLGAGWIVLLSLVGAGLVATVAILAVRRYREQQRYDAEHPRPPEE